VKTNRFIFDTNSLISALIISSSVSRFALKKADETGQLIFSKETLAELHEVLIRSKFDKYVSLGDRVEFVERLEARGEIIETSSNFTNCRDLKDNKFLNLAYDGRAAYIITGDLIY
jgi:putative PIN family toxin of toxin-antitoxin system